MSLLPPPPALVPMTHIDCEVRALVTLGPGPYGERRYVPLGGGTVRGPELNGTLVEGGVDWQVNRHGPAAVMARLARGDAVARDEYFFRTLVRFTTGTPAWAHLNRVMAIACGQREANWVRLDLYRLT